MTYRFEKRFPVFFDEKALLAFVEVDGPEIYLTFEMETLREMKLMGGEMETALAVVRSLEDVLGFRLTPEEIEYAVEDI